MRLWRLFPTAAPLLLALGLRFSFGGPPVFPTDDAYISQHAARYLFWAHDPAYPGTVPLAGATSLLHVLTLRLAMVLLSPSWAVELVTWLGAAAYLFGAATLITARVSATPARVACFALAVLLGNSAYHLASGQETGWAMAAVLWSTHWLATDTPERKRLPVLAGLLPWLRPDLVVLSAMLVASRLLTARRFIPRDAALVLACLLPGAIVYTVALGQPYPNTLQAKQYFFAFYAYPFVLKALLAARWLVPFTPALGVPLLALWPAVRHRSDRFVVGALALFVLSGILTAPNAFTHNFYRYLHPLLLPVLVAGLATWAGHSRPVWVTTLGLSACLVVPVLHAPRQLAAWHASIAIVTQAQGQIADWLNTHDPHARVLVHDAGYLSEHTAVVLTDLVGLKSPQNIAIHRRLTGPSNGARRGDAVHLIACEAHAEYFVAFNIWEEQFPGLTDGLQAHGWNPTLILRRVVTTDAEPVAFTLYRLIRPSCDELD